jgi:NADPH-dependent glutamate synthase beta subunit-like oxidoreductase
VGCDVLVVGGGDSAIDASRIARRLGARNITIMYRRTRSEMPTNPIEIHEAEVEGNQVEFLANISAITPCDGRLQVAVRRMRLGAFDKSGRRRPEEIANREELRLYDNVIIAIGQKSDVRAILGSTAGLGADARGNLAADGRTGATGRPNVFAGGDLVSGAATVVEAIGAGQVGARAIDQYLSPDPARRYPWEELSTPDVQADVERDVEEQAPVDLPLLTPGERLISVEVERTIAAGEACREAGRCLRCDYKG